MQLNITYVDYSPAELDEQVPFVIDLVRQMPGDDRPDYWLGQLQKPLRWNDDSIEKQITHIVVAARWAGTRIKPSIKNLPVGLAYVLDLSLLEDSTIDLNKCRYIAIGIADELTGSTGGIAGAISRFISRTFNLGKG